jgi:putative ABC transport system ATP-binding protein
LRTPAVRAASVSAQRLGHHPAHAPLDLGGDLLATARRGERHRLAELDDDDLSRIRASRIGFIFQSYNLIPQLTVLENIEVPLYYQGRLGAKERQRCRELAEMVGLGNRLRHRPTQLSGGQQQRVAIARSLINDPYFLLADEPTGNLDSVTTDEILGLLQSLNEAGKTIIMVTHEPDVGHRTRRIIRLMDGMVQSDRRLGAEEG